jgi:ArsR family transcriptional regulator, arsenate/arsenite/antimonite-responsive transcriptional repressor
LTATPYIHKSGYMETESAILALAALAQSTRLDVFRLLVKHEPQGLAAGEIAKALAVPQNTMSAHLAVLARAGLVMSERRSRSIIYRADLAAFGSLTSFLVEDCCGGRAELCMPVAACRPARGKRSKARGREESMS